MKELKKTTRFSISPDGKGGHYHIVYLNTDSGRGQLSFNDGHTHNIIYTPPVAEIPAQEAQYDELGNEIAPAQEFSPMQVGYWTVEADPTDGHTHDLEEYKIKTPKSKEKDEDIVNDIYTLYREGYELESDSRKKGRESDSFYSGDGQWTAQQKSELEALQRAAVTINLIGRYLDELKGYQMQQRTDIQYLPTEGGDAIISDILNIVSKNILDQCYYQREKSKIFHDQCVPGRGLINFYISFLNDFRGEIIVEKFPWDQAYLGPHEKEDLSDCEWLIKHKMYSLAKLKQLWGDKAKEIQKDYDSFCADGSREHIQTKPDQYEASNNVISAAPMIIGDDSIVDIARKEYRQIECWRKKYVNTPVAVNADDEAFINCFGWERKDLDSIKTLDGFYIIQKPSVKIRITKVAGNVLLSDEDPADLPTDDFHLIPVYAYKFGNRFWGKVEAAKDPQREVNYRRSQAIDIGNKMISYGHFITSETFDTPEEETKFMNQSTSPGGVYKLALGQPKPEKLEAPAFPQALAELMNIAQADVQSMINITVEPGGANESGTAFLNKQKQKLTSNEFLFDNLRFAEQKLGRLLIPLIQRYYSPERIARIVNYHAQTNEVKLGGTPISDFTEAQIVELLYNSDLTKYDTIVSESTYSPSQRMATWQMMIEMANNGQPISPNTLIELMPVPEAQKQKLLKEQQAQAESQSQAAATTADTEIAKTLFAKDVYPKKYLDMYGIDPNEVPALAQQNSTQTTMSPPNLQNNGVIPAEFP